MLSSRIAEVIIIVHETIDISDDSDLLRLAEDIRRRKTTAVLRNGDDELVVMMPVTENRTHKARRSSFKQKSQADINAFLAAAGGWKDLVDAEQLKRDIAESRARSSRPPITP
jgi:hypothetical protein